MQDLKAALNEAVVALACPATAQGVWERLQQARIVQDSLQNPKIQGLQLQRHSQAYVQDQKAALKEAIAALASPATAQGL